MLDELRTLRERGRLPHAVGFRCGHQRQVEDRIPFGFLDVEAPSGSPLLTTASASVSNVFTRHRTPPERIRTDAGSP